MKQISEAIEHIARDFERCMSEDGFDTFEEMANCYWWDTEDIKDFVRWELERTFYTFHVYIDEEDGLTVWNDSQSEKMSYKKFIAKAKRRANEIHEYYKEMTT